MSVYIYNSRNGYTYVTIEIGIYIYIYKTIEIVI